MQISVILCTCNPKIGDKQVPGIYIKMPILKVGHWLSENLNVSSEPRKAGHALTHPSQLRTSMALAGRIFSTWKKHFAGQNGAVMMASLTHSWWLFTTHPSEKYELSQIGNESSPSNSGWKWTIIWNKPPPSCCFTTPWWFTSRDLLKGWLDDPIFFGVRVTTQLGDRWSLVTNSLCKGSVNHPKRSQRIAIWHKSIGKICIYSMHFCCIWVWSLEMSSFFRSQPATTNKGTSRVL